MLSALHPILGENSLFRDVGKVFHPLFQLFGLILAGIYSVVPNYAVAIIGLTVIIMLALTPVTVKSTKSMIAMQRLQPEMKKLQAKYKGAENRETLNQEMMKLYKENGTSPFGACLPSLLQMPFLIVLYSLIRGLSNTAKIGGKIVALPRYIPTNSRMHQDLVLSGGKMHSWFGMDLSSKPFAHHGGNQALLTIPYLVLIAMAIFLQYYQMKQMNSRNPQAAAANPQMQNMQKFFPLIFGFIYLNVPTGATIYMVVSSAMRIGTQEVMFRTGIVTPVAAEREIGPAAKAAKPESKPAAKPPLKRSTATDGTVLGTSKGTVPPRKPTRPKSGAGGQGQGSANGNRTAGADGEAAPAPAPKEHPRSRSKRTRKAR
ncbi:MAG TPA: membrane protein insertase YidC [Acidimicrobiales bacterium]|nr:membrane protein insertase YidC [Acidimicrobiales bacterium]